MNTKPRVLDLFSGAGGCAMGYHLAGFEVCAGIDIAPQPRYPFDFIQADALEYLAEYGHEYDFIHASPPCQGYSKTKSIHQGKGYEYPDLLPQTRGALKRLGIPYVIENTPGAPMEKPLSLRGDMFTGLKVYRLRYFETSFHVWQPTIPEKKGSTSGNGKVYSTLDNADFVTVAGNNFRFSDAVIAMGISWMNRAEIRQSIPPAYTQYIGAEWLKQNGYKHQYPRMNVPRQLSLFEKVS